MPDLKKAPQDTQDTVDKKDQSLEDSTQQTNNQQDQHIDDKPEPIDPNYVADLERRIAEQQIQNRRLERIAESVEELKNKSDRPAAPAPRNIEQERASFYQDPIGKLQEQLSARDERILAQMQKMLEPLHNVANSFGRGTEYDRIKARVSNDPVFGKGLRDPDVAAAVDAIMNQEGVELSEESMKSAIAQAMGMKSMGGLRTTRRVNHTEDNDNVRIDPPTIPTTRTRDAVPVQRKELTEDDRIAMKFAGLKPGNPDDEREYWELIGNDKMTLSVHKKGS